MNSSEKYRRPEPKLEEKPEEQTEVKVPEIDTDALARADAADLSKVREKIVSGTDSKVDRLIEETDTPLPTRTPITELGQGPKLRRKQLHYELTLLEQATIAQRHAKVYIHKHILRALQICKEYLHDASQRKLTREESQYHESIAELAQKLKATENQFGMLYLKRGETEKETVMHAFGEIGARYPEMEQELGSRPNIDELTDFMEKVLREHKVDIPSKFATLGTAFKSRLLRNSLDVSITGSMVALQPIILEFIAKLPADLIPKISGYSLEAIAVGFGIKSLVELGARVYKRMKIEHANDLLQEVKDLDYKFVSDFLPRIYNPKRDE